jgi:7-cyano-7-deazaguanine reductase
MVDYSETELGKVTDYTDQYDAALLQPIPRSKARQSQTAEELLFVGVDVWTAYEISWLNLQGLPQVAIGEFVFPCTSHAIIESKSFKLYLNSFIQSSFANKQQVVGLLEKDLSNACGAVVEVVLYEMSEYAGFSSIGEPKGVCLDHRTVIIDCYHPDPTFLRSNADQSVRELLYSHLLKTNCPVTDQPDWASIYIDYQGPKIDQDGLLKYLVSYRQHQDFHEQCVEQIFSDILSVCDPSQLCVYARYMRRGGLDINPFRSTSKPNPPRLRQVRQ